MINKKQKMFPKKYVEQVINDLNSTYVVTNILNYTVRNPGGFYDIFKRGIFEIISNSNREVSVCV